MKRWYTVIGLSLAGLIGGCDGSDTGSQGDVELQANKDAALSVSQAIAAGTLSAKAEALLDPSFAYHGPAGMGPEGDGEMNREQYVQYMSALSQAFSGMTMDFTQVIAEGDKVGVHYTNSFKNTGAFFGLPPTGKDITIHGTFLRQVKDGKVVAEWDNPDVASLMAQLDVLQPVKDAALNVSKAIAAGTLKDKADSLLDPSFAYHGPAGMGPQGDGEMNKEGYVEYMSGLTASFSNMNMEFLQVVAEGDRVGVHYRNTMQHTGTFAGVPPTGKTIVITGTWVRQVKDGKAITEWDNPDVGALMAQVGYTMTPP